LLEVEEVHHKIPLQALAVVALEDLEQELVFL
jgi:hypothetical protein